jgi:hypothetical protein
MLADYSKKPALYYTFIRRNPIESRRDLMALRTSVKLGAVICFHAERYPVTSDSTKQLVNASETVTLLYRSTST